MSDEDENKSPHYWKILAAMADAGVKDEDVAITLERLDRLAPVTEDGPGMVYLAVNKQSKETHSFFVHTPFDKPLKDLEWGDVVLIDGGLPTIVKLDDFLEKYTVLPV